MNALHRWLWVLPLVTVALTATSPPQQDETSPPLPSSTVQWNNFTDTTSSTPTTPACDCVCGQYQRQVRIVGGKETLAHEFPWIVLLSYKKKFYCGGTLITDRHVLTAAHCTQQIRKEHVTVTVGEHNRSDPQGGAETRRVSRLVAHPSFSLATFNNDIAVLELDRPVDLGVTVKVACLPETDEEDYSGRAAVVAGWGRLAEMKTPSESLQKVEVPVLSADDCRSKGYPAHKITDNMICAGFPAGQKDACQGDSGGPLHAQDAHNVTEVIGVVSWGRGCARPNYPGIYTRVGRYTGWIDDQLAGECRCRRRPRHQPARQPRH